MNTSPRPPTPINSPSYPTEFQQVILEKSQNFVGRAFVFTAISNFLQRYDRGYFTIIGAPGSGKSAILAKYVTENPQVLYYNAQLPGKNRAEEFITSISTQIETENFTSLHSLLQQVSDKLEPQQKFIIAIDALDAVNHTDQTKGSNLFYLPRYLPRGVYFLLTRRPYLRKQSGLLIETPFQILDLATYPQENHEDIQAYIRRYVNNDEELTAELTAKSENNFMYTSAYFDCAQYKKLSDHLSQILPATFEKFDGLPPGLEAYYQQHKHKMIPPNSSSQEKEFKSSVLNVLVQVSSVVSAESIASTIDADEYDVEEVLENWREFLTLQEIDGEIHYSLYHSSFRDFLSKQVNFG
ncbi:AAA family ATPase [Nostoc sp. PCC 9305]|uniref:AAA family ATPase n=1 Tax=Nostoc sp. PCC 9305 TaxID=296636 RepID=UPI0039C73FAC